MGYSLELHHRTFTTQREDRSDRYGRMLIEAYRGANALYGVDAVESLAVGRGRFFDTEAR